MEKFKILRMTKEVSVPDVVICDVCKKEFSYEKDDMEIQEFVYIKFRGGYSSVFGDGTRIQLDICQHCIKEKLGEFINSVAETPVHL